MVYLMVSIWFCENLTCTARLLGYFRFPISFSICNFSFEVMDSIPSVSLIPAMIVAVHLARQEGLKDAIKDCKDAKMQWR